MTKNQKKLQRLIRAAVGLAIIRHDLRSGDDEMITGAESDRIGTDVALACAGIDTCTGKPLREYSAVINAMGHDVEATK